MFESFYQLREQPFDANPDPRFLYLSRTHREAFSSLLYRIQISSGFLAMVAQPGMGKTMLLFHLLHRLQPMARTAFVFQTQCTSHELLRHLLSEFECDTNVTDPVRMSQELKSLLLREANAGRRCILVIDEAQNLQPDVLETIRLLSNFETPRRKLLQIILSGQTELGEMLDRPELRQLRQRLSCIVHLQKFNPEETASYIAHRLAVAGYAGNVSDLFTIPALTRIAQLSGGVPRVISNICFNALSLGFALEFQQIDLDIIEEVAGDLGLTAPLEFTAEEPASSWDRAFHAITAVCAGQETKTTSDSAIALASEEKLEASPQSEPSEEKKEAVADTIIHVTSDDSHSISDHIVVPPASTEVQPQLDIFPSLAASQEVDTVYPTPERIVGWNRVPGVLKKFKIQLLVRICACALLLSIAPVINPHGNHTVSAQNAVPAAIPTLATTMDLVSDPDVPRPGAEANLIQPSDDGRSQSSSLQDQSSEQVELENIWKATRRPGSARNLRVMSPDLKRLIDALPLPSIAATNILHSNLILNPPVSPFAQAHNQSSLAQPRSEILRPAMCRQEQPADAHAAISQEEQTHQGCQFLSPLERASSSR